MKLFLLVACAIFVNVFPIVQPAARTWPSMLATAAADVALLVFFLRRR